MKSAGVGPLTTHPPMTGYPRTKLSPGDPGETIDPENGLCSCQQSGCRHCQRLQMRVFRKIQRLPLSTLAPGLFKPMTLLSYFRWLLPLSLRKMCKIILTGSWQELGNQLKLSDNVGLAHWRGASREIHLVPHAQTNNALVRQLLDGLLLPQTETGNYSQTTCQ